MGAPGEAGLLRRILRPAAPAAPAPLTPARALRLALTRAAERSVGLAVAVLGIAEEEGPLDDLLSRLEEGLMVATLRDGEGAVGLVALDAELRAALIEAQTLGRPSASPAEPRPVTAADRALAAPFLDAALAEIAAALEGTALAGWLGRARVEGAMAAAREAALTLADGRYRVVRMTVDLGAGGRQGLALLLSRVVPPLAPKALPAAADWSRGLSDQVLRAEAVIDAVLHRLRLPLGAAEALEPGQVIPLPGVTVASVRLVAQGGRDLGPARLGQVSGRRAVRLEVPPAPALADVRPPPGGAG